MATVSSSSGGTSERAIVLLAQEMRALGIAPRSESSLGMGAVEIGWHVESDLKPFRESSSSSIWRNSPFEEGLGEPRAATQRVIEPPMIDGALIVRRVSCARDRCINITLSGVSALSVAGGSYGLYEIYEIYEKTEADLKILAFVPLCLLLVIGCGVSVYRGYLGCCRRS